MWVSDFFWAAVRSVNTANPSLSIDGKFEILNKRNISKVYSNQGKARKKSRGMENL
jgi:hypothetical protein